jgi:hypothetical protein
MQIFRRSNLPSLLTSHSHPPRAPHDEQVRQWMNGQSLPKKLTEPLARLIEKSLARKPQALDLSTADPRALESLPVDLLRRLGQHTHRLTLPSNCPKDIGRRVSREMDVNDVTPIELAPRRRLVFAQPAAQEPPVYDIPRHRPMFAQPAAQEPPVYDVPPRRRGGDYDLPRPHVSDYDVPPRHPRGPTNTIPGYIKMSDLSGYVPHRPGLEGTSDVDSPYDNAPPISNESSIDSLSSGRGAPTRMASAAERADIRRQRELLDRPSLTPLAGKQELMLGAIGAMKLPRAWLRSHASLEGPNARCVIRDADANALADALKGIHAGQLPSHVGKSLVTAQRLLAGREPNKPLELTADDVQHLDRALDAVRILVANAAPEGVVPALPRRSRSPGG